MDIKSANGVRGCILDSFDGTYFFRVYNKDFTFKDYDLHHCDLFVTIDDADAYFYEDGDNLRLDHSPATLGKNDV